MNVKLSDIRITDRIRKDNGDLESLARSIDQHGLLNPITLMECENGYILLAGFRRFSAFGILKRDSIEAKVVSPLDAEEQLRIEIEENENRKEFTTSEKVEYAEKLKAIEEEKSRRRMNWRANQHQADQPLDANEPLSQAEPHGWDRGPTHKRRTRDELAQKVGFKSGKQLERATYVAKQRPDLMEQIDAGQKTITGAYEEARGIKRRRNEPEIAKPVPLESVGIVNGKNGHKAISFNRPDGFPFVMREIDIATNLYLSALQAASNHYTKVMQSSENTETIFLAIHNTFEKATALFNQNIEEV